MESKIIFLDLDGTLVHPHQGISEKNRFAVIQAMKNGHLVYICTGRNLCGIDNELLELGFDGIISSAGGYIQIKDEVIEKSYIPSYKVQEIIDIFSRNNIFYTLESTECTYANEDMIKMFALGKDVEQMNSEMQRMCKEVVESFNIKPLEEYYKNPLGVHKVSFIATKAKQLEEPKDILGNDFQFVIHDIFSTETLNGEIIINHTNKATAIEKVLHRLQRNKKDTIAFGDSMNDYEMIQAVHHGVAMKNAPDTLKEVANAICGDVKEDAIYYAFQDLQLI